MALFVEERDWRRLWIGFPIERCSDFWIATLWLASDTDKDQTAKTETAELNNTIDATLRALDYWEPDESIDYD